MYVVLKEDPVLISLYVVLYIYVHGLCVSSIHSLIVCYLLHTHTQLLIDPQSSNEITNCCTSSCAFKDGYDMCIHRYGACVCINNIILSVVHLYIYIVFTLSYTHTVQRPISAVMD